MLDKASCTEFEFRKLEAQDYNFGFLKVLEGLTKVGQVTEQEFTE